MGALLSSRILNFHAASVANEFHSFPVYQMSETTLVGRWLQGTL
jgi:hypothetical protein